MPFRLEEATIDALHRAIEAGEITCVQVVQHYIDRAEEIRRVRQQNIPTDREATNAALGARPSDYAGGRDPAMATLRNLGMDAEDIAKLVLDCAADGAPERVMPQVTGYLATAGYLFPALRSLMLPIMERQGKAAKQKYRERRAASRSGS